MAKAQKIDHTDARRLVAAVLLQAVRDAQRPPSPLSSEATSWLEGPGIEWAALLGLRMPDVERIKDLGHRHLVGRDFQE